MSSHLILAASLVVYGLFWTSSARGERLVTHHFEGNVIDSTSDLVRVGDRLVGTFTYDLDWEDLLPQNPNSFAAWFPSGFAEEPFPPGSPLGMSYRVASISHQTSELAELLIDDDPQGDLLYFGSDALGGGFGPQLVAGAMEFLDASGTAFSSDQPPSILELAAFSTNTFWGFDGEGNGFTATIDTLRLVPEPATMPLVVTFLLLSHRIGMRKQ